jgi:hypothetical protein
MGRGKMSAARRIGCAVTVLAMGWGCGGDERLPAGHARIGPSGGELSGPDGGGMIVPAGAVAQTTEFWVEPADANFVGLSPLGKPFRYGPESAVLKKMVTLRVPFDPALIPSGRSLADVRVYRSDPSGKYKELATNKPASGAVIAEAGTDVLATVVVALAQTGD